MPNNKKNQNILSKIINSDRNNRPHAILLQGPENLGKRKIAKETAAKLLNEPEFSISHPDLFMLDGKGEDIEIATIAKIREVKEKIMLSRQKSPVKVVLGADIDRMKAESLNTFLKSLEEPLEDVVFILTASSRTLATIESRCLILRFAPTSWQIEEKADLHRLSPPTSLTLRDLMSKNIPEKLEIAEKLSKEVEKTREMLYNWIKEARQFLLISDTRGSAEKSLGILKNLISAFEMISLPGVNEKRVMENLVINL